MMRKIRAFVVVCAISGFTVSMPAGAEAATIDGGIRFAGAINPNTDFANTNSIDIVDNVANILCFSGSGEACTGDYASLNSPTGGGQAVYNDFTFNPLPAGGVVPLWIFTRGDVTYSFDLTQVTAFNRTSDGTSIAGITIFGSGVARITGFEATQAAWSFSATRASNTYAFASTTDASGLPVIPNSVPDAGSTLALLGFGLGAIVTARRRFAHR